MQNCVKFFVFFDKYAFIDIYANHTNITKFSNNQNLNYRNVFFEFQKFVRFYEQQTNKKLFLTIFEFFEIQKRFNQKIENKIFSTNQRNANIVDEKNKTHESTKSFNVFFDTFHNNENKMIQKNKFNSENESMIF